MSTTTDNLVTVFSVRGLNTLLSAYASVATSLQAVMAAQNAAVVSVGRVPTVARAQATSAAASPEAAPTYGAGAAAAKRVRQQRESETAQQAKEAEAAQKRTERAQDTAAKKAESAARRATAQAARNAKRIADQEIAEAKRGENALSSLNAGMLQSFASSGAAFGLFDSKIGVPIRLLAMMEARVRTLPPAWQSVVSAQTGVIASSLALGAVSLAATGAIVSGIRKAVDAYLEFGNTILQIKSLAGATARESIQLATLFRVAGVNDVQAARDIVRLTKDMFNTGGRNALGRLGIAVSPSASPVQTLNQVIAALNKIPEGFQRARIEEELFGARGAMALQPILRMTAAQRAQVLDLSNSMQDSAGSIQQFQFAMGLLGTTLLIKVAVPIAQSVMPALQAIVPLVVSVTNAIMSLNDATHGLLVPFLVFASLGASIAGIAIAVSRVTSAFRALLPILKMNAALEAFLTALAGPSGIAKVLGAAAVTGVVIGGSALAYNYFQAQDKGRSDTAQSKFSNAVDRFDAATQRISASFDMDRLNKGGRPSEMGALDVLALQRIGALGAIG